MKEKTDLRIIKTKKTLYNTLIKLMKDNNFEKIKISDICESALINRSTFYAHYEDKYDLLIDLIEDLKLSFLERLKNNDNPILSKPYLMELLNIILEQIEEEKEVYNAILQNNKNGILIDFLMDVIERDIKERLKENSDIKASNIPVDIITKFYIGGIISIVVNVITSKNNYSKEELLLYFDKLIPEKL